MLWAHDVEATWRNVLADHQAAQAAAAASTGDDFVPVVTVDQSVLSNPSWAELAGHIGREEDEPVRPAPPRTYASAGACGPPPPSHTLKVDALRGGVVLVIAVSAYQSGHHGRPLLALLLGVLSFLTWALSRPDPL
ncbi:WGS project CABT00000000 data, contig 2.11 [Nocardioides sp. PD653]|nr:WGS project CABT00000000 data, contig 2.11 [Nocardioides sp. PD653-B2]GAW55712.1 WGS project CABT00000000 data, contig 2.11 [Nocardioides sp. PD653]